jgi:putative acetyltransferase
MLTDMNSPTPTFHRATAADSPEVVELVFSVLREYGLTPEPDGTDYDLTHLDEVYFNNGGHFEICRVDGRVVGTWGIFNMADTADTRGKVCELRKMYLCQSQRGRGLGKILLERALAKAKMLGFTRVELETASVLKEAVALYQRYGFKPIDRHSVARCDQAYQLEL